MATGSNTGYQEYCCHQGHRVENLLLYIASHVIHHAHNVLSQAFEKKFLVLMLILAQR